MKDFLIAGGILLGIVALYARREGKTLGQVFSALTGQPNSAPPWTPDTSMTDLTQTKPGFKEVCGQVVQVGGGIAMVSGNPAAMAVGAGATVGSPLVCAGAKGVVDVSKKIGSKVKGWLS